jgi:hypothetical protein
MTDTLRNATLQDMVEMLRDQQGRKVDVVAPAATLNFRDGLLRVSGLEAELTEHGVTDPNGIYRPTESADASVAERLDIPVRYLRKLRAGRPDLFDANVNGLLKGRTLRGADGTKREIYPSDSRSFLLRMFAGSEPGQEGVLRALLSDRFGIVDNLDVLTAVLDGIRQANVDVEIRDCDLTDSRMNVKAFSPQVSALAPEFLKGYRNPFDHRELADRRDRISGDLDYWRGIAAREGMGFEAGQEPIVFAGFRFSNSEVGKGAVSLVPEVMVKVCRNGLVLNAFAMNKVHLGARMDEGIQWNQEVQGKALAVITAQAKQAVAEWMSPEFLAARVSEIETACGAPVTEPEKAMKVLGKKLGFTEGERDGILSHFIAGGQLTAGGVANAITSFSQTVSDGDRADALDGLALTAMSLV